MAEPEPEPERQPQPEPEPEPDPDPGCTTGSAKRVLFIRHGESVANIEAKQKIPYRDHTVDAPLTPLGMRQARSWRCTAASWGVETVLVSPLARAIQTADAVFSELPEQRMEICLSIRERWWRNPECHARPTAGYDDLNRPEDGSDYETLGDVCARRFGAQALSALSLAPRTYTARACLLGQERMAYGGCKAPSRGGTTARKKGCRGGC